LTAHFTGKNLLISPGFALFVKAALIKKCIRKLVVPSNQERCSHLVPENIFQRFLQQFQYPLFSYTNVLDRDALSFFGLDHLLYQWSTLNRF